ncbi:MAG: hypothetical protein K0S71_1522 [Clostridia bacterium]|jgi:hypothetical protein|nr:hypothetical protein [Clostridia bacterium]
MSNIVMGKKEWFIADMYWPINSSEGEYVSHESICVLNTSDNDASINITLYYEDRPEVYLETVVCGARRTRHIRMDKIKDQAGSQLEKGIPYAAMVISSIPVIVQYTRLDATQPACTLMTTMAY